MKNLFCLFLLFLALSSAASAQGSISATSANWGKTPINGTPKANDILVNNSGNSSLKFIGIIIGGTDPKQFSVDSSTVIGRNLGPGENTNISVRYRPRATGNHQATITLLAEDGDGGPILTGTAELSGTGVAPQMSFASLIDFGNIDLSQGMPLRRQFVIANDNYEFASVLTLSDIVSDPVGAVSGTTDKSGEQGFRYDRQKYFGDGNKIILQPGETATIEIEFLPMQAGQYRATIGFSSNAVNEVYSEWVGTATGVLVSVGDAASGGFSVSPNPAASQARISFSLDAAQTVGVKVLNLLGETIYSASNFYGEGDNELRLDASAFAPGMYYVRFVTTETVRTLPLHIGR